jgi:hypothetical protein
VIARRFGSQSVRAFGLLATLAGFAVVASACTDNKPDNGDAEDRSDRITAAIRFRGSEVVEGLLPDASDSRVSILPLEPTVLVGPGDSAIMSLDVDDPDGREVAAILMQLEGEDDHQRVPVEGGGAAVQSQLDLEDELCTGRCDTAFVVLLKEAVELEDGTISRSNTRQLVIDCRERGDADACAPGEKDDDAAEELLCGDVTKGQTVLTGDSVIDAELDAVRQLSDAIGKRTQAVEMAKQKIASALDLPDDTSASNVATTLKTRIDMQTEMGLMLRLGDRGCAIRLLRVGHSLRSCDPEGGGELGELTCSGVCEPTAEGSCDGASSQGCRGVLVDSSCDGVCAGACEVTLDSPATCEGTCNGSCDGECTDDGHGGCNGPCSGLCTGTCRALNNGTCGGKCTGLCDTTSDEEPACDAPLHPYCGVEDPDAIGCNGDCFGGADIDSGDALCQSTALAVGKIAPRCEPPLIQLAFGFAAELPPADQSALASSVDDLNAPLAALVTEGDRLDLLGTATMDLLDAAKGDVRDRIDTGLGDSPEDPGLVCADARLTDSSDWLEDQLTVVEDLRTNVTDLLAPLTIIE